MVKAMRIISEKRFREFIRRHAAAAPSMTTFMKILRHVAWRNIQEVRAQFPHADLVTVRSGRVVTVFNVGGGNFRVIIRFAYNYQTAYILVILTHAEYSRDQWKDQL